jgi:class 3 adenylate cyclase
MTEQDPNMGVTRRLPLPVGVVTLLFSDIEGSTRLVRVLGDAFERRVLADHNRPLREAWRRRGGVEVRSEGDAFFVAFPEAVQAVSAAVAGQRALRARVAGRRVASCRSTRQSVTRNAETDPGAFRICV